MDEALSVRKTSSLEPLGLLIHKLPSTQSETRERNISPGSHAEDIQNLPECSNRMRVFLRMRSPGLDLDSTPRKQDQVFSILNFKNLVTKIPIAESTSSRRSGQLINVDTQNIRRYRFAGIFGPEDSQSRVFKESARQNILDLLGGKNSTLISYGTTNSGKTHTLFGTDDSLGIIPRSIKHLFSLIDCTPRPWYKPIHDNEVFFLDDEGRNLAFEERDELFFPESIDKTRNLEAFEKLEDFLKDNVSQDDSINSVWLSFIEIYNETIFDLLTVNNDGKNAQLKLITDSKGNIRLKGIKMIPVSNDLEAFQIMMTGKSRLSVAPTTMNAKSSRSHAIFTLYLLRYPKGADTGNFEISRLTFCDLAGSGGLQRSSNPQRVKESRCINASLLVLGKCFRSLNQSRSVKQNLDINGSFRESNLTRILQRALSGRENITLIVNINPSSELYSETQSVLNFSSIAKKIGTAPSKEVRGSTDLQMTTLNSRWDLHTVSSKSQTTTMIGDLYQKNYYEFKEEYDALSRELTALKASNLNREYEIRQELSDFYSSMIKDLKESWIKKNQEIEAEREELLKWSVNQVEVFYKERIDNMKNRKRRRLSDSGDYGDVGDYTLETLEAENAEATKKIVSLREVVENLRKKNEELRTQKSELLFQMAVTKKELKDLKEFRRMNETIGTEEENAMNKRRETFLFEYNENWAKTTELEDQLKERSDLIENLREKMEERDKELFEMGEKCKREEARGQIAIRKVEELEDELSKLCVILSQRRPSDDRIITSSDVKSPADVSSSDSMYKISMIEAESSRVEDPRTPEIPLKTLVKVPALVPFELSEVTSLSFLDSPTENLDKSGVTSSETSNGDDSGIMLSSGSQRIKVETHDKCSQVSIISVEDLEKMERKLECLIVAQDPNFNGDASSGKSKEIKARNIIVCSFKTDKMHDIDHYRDILESLDSKTRKCEGRINELSLKLETGEESGSLSEHIKKSPIIIENQLNLARSELEKTTLMCSTQHVIKIERLESELNLKTSEIKELIGKLEQVDGKVTRLEDSLTKCQIRNEELRIELREKSRTQSTLESHLQESFTRVQERESEFMSLQSSLNETKQANLVNYKVVYELERGISDSKMKIENIESELLRSEKARETLERIYRAETDFLHSRLSTLGEQGAFLSMICQEKEDIQEEVEDLRSALYQKETEINSLKQSRTELIEKYELLVRQIQDAEKYKPARRIFPSRKASKSFMKSTSVSSRSKQDGSSLAGKDDSLSRGSYEMSSSQSGSSSLKISNFDSRKKLSRFGKVTNRKGLQPSLSST